MTFIKIINAALTISFRSRGQKTYLDYFLESYGIKYFYQYISLFLLYLILAFALFGLSEDVEFLRQAPSQNFIIIIVLVSFTGMLIFSSLFIDSYFYPNFLHLIKTLPLSKFQSFNISVLLNIIDYKFLAFLAFFIMDTIFYLNGTLLFHDYLIILFGIVSIYLLIGLLLTVWSFKKVDTAMLNNKKTRFISTLMLIAIYYLFNYNIITLEFPVISRAVVVIAGITILMVLFLAYFLCFYAYKRKY